MQDFIYANPHIKVGDIALLAGAARGIEVVITALGGPFTATREDEDVWALERGARFQCVESRPLTAEEMEPREFARNPRRALYNRVMRDGAAHTPVDMQELATLSHDVRNQQTLYRDGGSVVAEKRVHVYDGDDIVTRKALSISTLPTQFAALVTELTAAAAQSDEDEWETL